MKKKTTKTIVGMSSDHDTFFVDLHVDEKPSFSSSQSKTDTFSSEGLCYWSKALFVGLITVCIIAIILVLLFFVIGKKFKKNKRSTTTSTITTAKEVEVKDISSSPKYQPVPNV
ncbi:unnamed protein product [Rotaria sordida]|uniref:Uncharacterized protein n=1 Tax=Rotaria sordida TaxID=392033 RepID=A0A814M0G1_9BILA|nr:unnamed protein product [Rotaria sordida]CAF1256446.1 unnamed protein product [Rotaria sordida]